MKEYKLTAVNRVEPERIASILAELIADREGMTVMDVKVVQKCGITAAGKGGKASG